LAGDDGRSTAVTFFEDFEEVGACGGIEGFKPPIVEDEQLYATERTRKADVTTVTAGKCEVGEQLGNALVENGAIVATGFVTES
jgi:hypothetical protein